MIIIISVSR